VNAFVFSGGTALCGFYIPYRYSEDLDFFSNHEFEINDLTMWLSAQKKQIGFISFDIQTSFNRNLIFLKYEDQTLKTEFTYYPFPSNHTEKYMNILVDSVSDIAQNKLFTIYQNPRLRDYMDLYMICTTYDYSIEDIRRLAKTKFDWDIDPIQLGSQLLRSGEFQDSPRLLKDLDIHSMELYFREQASKLKTEIFSK